MKKEFSGRSTNLEIINVEKLTIPNSATFKDKNIANHITLLN
jgi:hypothetical protein